MVALILAAGFSTRLEPRTLTTPKQLLPIGDKVLLDFVLDKIIPIKKHFQKTILVTNGKFYLDYKKWADQNRWKIKLISDKVMSKSDKLGAIGDLLYVIEQEKIEDDLFVCASDSILSNFNLEDLYHLHQNKKSSVTIARLESKIENLKAGSCLKLNRFNQVVKFVEKPKNPFSNLYGAPFYIIKKADLKHLKKIPDQQKDNAGQIMVELVESSTVFAARYVGEILHLTSEKDYQQIIAKYK